MVIALLGCQRAAPADGDITALNTCRAAFQRWVNGDEELNQADADLVAVIASQERVQRRVFDLCGLAEAEDLNNQVLPKRPPGIGERMIEPNMRTFAEVECVDESPLLDGSRLCGEVSK